MLDYRFASINEIHNAYRDRKLTVRELVVSFLDAIARLDQGEDGLHAVMEVNPDALFIAKAMDQQLDSMLQSGTPLPPLFGIPILLKDNINTGDRMHTTAGTLALNDLYAPYDATITAKLREAGALILGKANMTELANYISNNMVNGFSARGGQGRNPYGKDLDTGGSSSGSGIAVAAGLCTVAVGTETCGSILSPASNNGVVGIKPTLGRLSRKGIIPICSTHDTAGPIARSVEDAAILMMAMEGSDPADAATLSWPEEVAEINLNDLPNLTGVRIGINSAIPVTSEAYPRLEDAAAFARLCSLLEQAGATLVPNTNLKTGRAIYTIMIHEYKACMNDYLASVREATDIHTMADIIAFNEAHAETAIPLGQHILLRAQNETSGRLIEPTYLEALAEREETIAELDRVFDENNIDIMLTETFSTLAPFCGFPSMTVPMGQRENRSPIPSYWMARRFDEAVLVKVGRAVEKLLNLNLRP